MLISLRVDKELFLIQYLLSNAEKKNMNVDSIFGMQFEIAIILFASLIAIVAGGMSLFVARRNYKLAKKTRSWPQTTGTIVESEVVYSWSYSGRSAERRAHKIYFPEVHYKYNVDKQEYHSSQIFIGSLGKSGSYSYAQKYVSKYPVGKQVRVQYSPNIYQLTNKERYAVLETGVKFMIYVSGFLSFLIMGAGSAGTFLILKQEYTYGILMAIGAIALGIWLGFMLSKLSDHDAPPDVGIKYKLSRNQIFGKIPGTDGFAGGQASQQLMDIFSKAEDSFLSKTKWRIKKVK